MCRAAEEAFRSAREGRTVKTFKVEARRSEKAFPLTSMEINRAVGGYVLRRHRDISVDVHDPDVTLNIEVRSEGILIYSRVIPGPGGLPVGTSSKAMLLLSGGIDSPVAGWYALKRGIALEAVHFHSFPFTSERSLQRCGISAKSSQGMRGRYRSTSCISPKYSEPSNNKFRPRSGSRS